MILSSHIIIASAASAPFADKPLNFFTSLAVIFISLASHYLADYIPHWDYHLASIEEFPVDNNGNEKRRIIATKKTISKDFLKNLLDGFIGLIGAVLILGFPDDLQKVFFIALVVFFSILPDALEVLCLIFKKFPLTLIHKFHNFSHGQRIFLNQPVSGALSQTISIGIIIFFLFALRKFF